MSRQAGGNGRAPEGAKIHHWTRMASRPIIPGQGCNASVVSRHLNGVAWRRHLNNGVAVSLPCFLRRSVRWRLQRVGHPLVFLPHALSLKIPTLGNATPCSEESWSLSLVTAVLPWKTSPISVVRMDSLRILRHAERNTRVISGRLFNVLCAAAELALKETRCHLLPDARQTRLVPPGVGLAR